MGETVNEERIAAARRQLDALKRDYRERTRALLGALAERLAELQDISLLDEVESQLHKLAGSGGSFGFSDLSREARGLELEVRILRGNPADADLNLLAQRLRALQQWLDAAGQSAPGQRVAATGSPGNVLLWIPASSERSARLLSTLEQFGHEAQAVESREDLRQMMAAQPPEALLIDIDSEGASAAARRGLLEFVAELRHGPEFADWLLFTFAAEDSLPLRLQAARAGASGFFPHPFDPMQVVDRLERQRKERLGTSGRVLLVDDDELLARHHSAVLEAGGFDTRICTDPLKALDVMDQFQPELVLMDLYMPVCSGPELARVIRMHDAWLATPLVFLSAETDFDLQLTAASEGADDFLTKPIADGHLVAAVRTRVERARQVARLIHSDSLTGLLKHGRIKEELAAQLARSKRLGAPLCAAMLDIDHFKRVNDRFGHPVGDQVLRALGNLMRQRARKSDRIGRYGGEEFLLILPECEIEDATRLVDDLRERISGLRFSAAGEEFAVTLSAGIACFPQYTDHDELLAQADQALYRAKQNGRDRTERAD